MASSSFADSLPPYIRDRFELAIQLSGYPILIEEQDHLEFDSVVSFASPASPHHTISYSPAYGEFSPHFVLSSAEKIRRYYAAPAHDRFVPCLVGDGHLSPDEHRELTRRVAHLPPHVLAAVSHQLHTGLVRQLTSFPLDARVERDLFAGVIEHRERQLAYLRRQLQDLEPHFSAKIRAFSPPKTHAASSAMNCAFAQVCGLLTGDQPSRVIRYSDYYTNGRDLVRLLDDVQEAGPPGDRRATDAWATRLGLRACYDWVALEAQR